MVSGAFSAMNKASLTAKPVGGDGTLSTGIMYSVLSAATGYTALGSGVFDISILASGSSYEQGSANIRKLIYYMFVLCIH